MAADNPLHRRPMPTARVEHTATPNAGRFASFELNPVRVLPAGQGLLVLDAALEPFEASC